MRNVYSTYKQHTHILRNIYTHIHHYTTIYRTSHITYTHTCLQNIHNYTPHIHHIPQIQQTIKHMHTTNIYKTYPTIYKHIQPYTIHIQLIQTIPPTIPPSITHIHIYKSNQQIYNKHKRLCNNKTIKKHIQQYTNHKQKCTINKQ